MGNRHTLDVEAASLTELFRQLAKSLGFTLERRLTSQVEAQFFHTGGQTVARHITEVRGSRVSCKRYEVATKKKTSQMFGSTDVLWLGVSVQAIFFSFLLWDSASHL